MLVIASDVICIKFISLSKLILHTVERILNFRFSKCPVQRFLDIVKQIDVHLHSV